MWRVVRNLFDDQKSTRNITGINAKTDTCDIACKINKYVSEIGPNLARQIPDSMLEVNYEFDGDFLPFEFTMTNREGIAKILDSLSPNKSTGVDGVPIRFVKLCREIIISIMTHIVNLSMRTLIVPSGWKIASICPLYKEGDPMDLANYIGQLQSCLQSAKSLKGSSITRLVLSYKIDSPCRKPNLNS